MFNMFAGAPNISDLNADASPAAFTGMLSSPSTAPQVVAYLVKSRTDVTIRRGDILMLKLIAKASQKMYNGVPIEYVMSANVTENASTGTPTAPTADHIYVLAAEAVTWTRIPSWVGGASTDFVVSVPCTVQGTDVVRMPTSGMISAAVMPGDACHWLKQHGIDALVSVHAAYGAKEHTVYIRTSKMVAA
jgi:hypothetical protein